MSLYGRAIRLDPSEPAYPWNLSSALTRLDQNELALGYLLTAIGTGERVREEGFCDAGAYLALAETALNMGADDLALVAIARARELDGPDGNLANHAQRLLADIRSSSTEEEPVATLVRLLERLAT